MKKTFYKVFVEFMSKLTSHGYNAELEENSSYLKITLKEKFRGVKTIIFRRYSLILSAFDSENNKIFSRKISNPINFEVYLGWRFLNESRKTLFLYTDDEKGLFVSSNHLPFKKCYEVKLDACRSKSNFYGGPANDMYNEFIKTIKTKCGEKYHIRRSWRNNRPTETYAVPDKESKLLQFDCSPPSYITKVINL